MRKFIENGEIYTAEDIKKIYLGFELGDIQDNLNAYISGECANFNLENQCDKIKNVNKKDIGEIVWEINTFWGGNLEEVKEDNYTQEDIEFELFS